MLILQVTDIRRRLQRHGFNPQVLSDQLVVAVAHLLYDDRVEGVMMTYGTQHIRIEEADLPGLVKQARGLLSYDFDPRRRKQNEWWFVQGMPVLTIPKNNHISQPEPIEEFFKQAYPDIDRQNQVTG